MRVRFRRLKHHRPSVRDVIASVVPVNERGHLSVDASRAAAVVEPEVLEEGTATVEEVRAMARRGALAADDLVDLGRGWESVDQAPELAGDE